jgi:hypothetical protein
MIHIWAERSMFAIVAAINKFAMMSIILFSLIPSTLCGSLIDAETIFQAFFFKHLQPCGAPTGISPSPEFIRGMPVSKALRSR